MLCFTWFFCPLISSLLPHFCAQPVLGFQLCSPWQLEHYNDSFSTLQFVESLMQKERKEGEAGSEQRWHLLPPGSAEALRKQSKFSCFSDGWGSCRSSSAARDHSPWNSPSGGQRLGLAFCRWCSHRPMKAVPRTAKPVGDPSRTGSSMAGPAPGHRERESSSEKCSLHKQVKTQGVRDGASGF